jgi:hypothetical protein
LKFFLALITVVLGFYLVLDLLLGRMKIGQSVSEGKSPGLVKEMAAYLETNPQLQKTIYQNLSKPEKGGTIPSGVPATASTLPDADTSSIDRYFGKSASDQYFKNYVMAQQKLKNDDLDGQTSLFIELSNHIRENPKESIETLETAIGNIPQNQTTVRAAIRPAYIHSAIQFIEESDTDENGKKAYLKRLIQTANDEEIKEALKSHFPDLTD